MPDKPITPEELEKIEAEKDAAFRAEIERLKEEEEKGEGKKTAHFSGERTGVLDIDKLTRDDRKIWEEIESGLPYEGKLEQEFKKYTAQVNEEAERGKEGRSPLGLTSRQIFRAYLGNRIMIVPYEIEKKKKEQEKQNP